MLCSGSRCGPLVSRRARRHRYESLHSCRCQPAAQQGGRAKLSPFLLSAAAAKVCLVFAASAAPCDSGRAVTACMRQTRDILLRIPFAGGYNQRGAHALGVHRAHSRVAGVIRYQTSPNHDEACIGYASFLACPAVAWAMLPPLAPRRV